MADRHTIRALQDAMDALEADVLGIVVHHRFVEVTLRHRRGDLLAWRARHEREGEKPIDGEGATPLTALDACVDAVEAHDEQQADAEAVADSRSW